MFNFKLLKNKIFISVLLISFTSSLLSVTICDISHEKTEIAVSGELSKIENQSGNQKTEKFNIQSKTDDCYDSGISNFIIDIRSNGNNFYSQVLVLPNFNQVVSEYRSEKGLYSKAIGKFFLSPPKISNKLYKHISLFLI